MKDNSFLSVCEKDIKEIYSMLDPYLPDFEIGHLDQSMIYEKNRKILCRSLRNDKKTIIGHEIVIYVYDTGEVARLIKRENSLKFENHYYCDNSFIKEMVRISYKNGVAKRYFTYCDGFEKIQFDEKYDFNSSSDVNNYLNSDSIKNTFEELKNKNKVKKRT